VLHDTSPVEGADDVLESPDTRLRTRTRPRVGAALRPALERPHWPLLLAVADTLALVAAFTIVVGPIETAADGSWHSVMAVFPVVALLALAGRRMYTRTVGMSTFDAVSHIVGATAVAALAAIVLGHETGAWVPRGKVELLWFASAALVGLGRVALGRLRRKALRQGLIGTPTLIIGSGRVATRLEERLLTMPEMGLVPIGFVDNDPVDDHADERVAPVLGALGDLPEIVEATRAQHVVITFLAGGDALLLPIVRICESLNVGVSVVPRLFELTTERLSLQRIGALPVYELLHADPKGWQFRAKYAVERVVAAIAFALLLPLLLLIALAVKLSSPGPVLYRQLRIGRDGHAFDLLKFRSMKTGGVPALDDQDPERGQPTLGPGGIEGADRRTGVGKFLRATSLDELPQLVNVIMGDMAIIGPRPERPEFVEWFGRHIHRYTDRHRVRSGITGWAQVHKLRGKTSITERSDMDNWYIENWSPWLDLRIACMTVGALFHRAE
jgi:exopolysaccharide biosynthesis polyprenyl glycosylphosphotransferase